ncbi:hypothetical protein CYMTET_54329 [Cymbomonas tetramitiformis]|uniref:Uncharacterized protein n=1 Tax=Cymbomonas tetramitiformis TaxID=36881 RepID=A0AAE0BFC0_9CHLO|nr:hypothetical protein CYMTET_54329 [Cymbomonas tetramitiformis]
MNPAKFIEELRAAFGAGNWSSCLKLLECLRGSESCPAALKVVPFVEGGGVDALLDFLNSQHNLDYEATSEAQSAYDSCVAELRSIIVEHPTFAQDGVDHQLLKTLNNICQHRPFTDAIFTNVAEISLTLSGGVASSPQSRAMFRETREKIANCGVAQSLLRQLQSSLESPSPGLPYDTNSVPPFIVPTLRFLRNFARDPPHRPVLVDLGVLHVLPMALASPTHQSPPGGCLLGDEAAVVAIEVLINLACAKPIKSKIVETSSTLDMLLEYAVPPTSLVLQEVALSCLGLLSFNCATAVAQLLNREVLAALSFSIQSLRVSCERGEDCAGAALSASTDLMKNLAQTTVGRRRLSSPTEVPLVDELIYIMTLAQV